IEHAACIEFDDDAEHVVVLKQIGDLLERGGDPGEIERVGAQPGEYADVALRGRRPLLIVHGERERSAVRENASSALDHLACRIPIQNLEPEGEADLLVCGLKLRGVANT